MDSGASGGAEQCRTRAHARSPGAAGEGRRASEARVALARSRSARCVAVAGGLFVCDEVGEECT